MAPKKNPAPPTPKLGDAVLYGVEHEHDRGFTTCAAIVTSVEPGGFVLIAAFWPTGSLLPLPSSPVAYSAQPAAGRWWPR